MFKKLTILITCFITCILIFTGCSSKDAEEANLQDTSTNSTEDISSEADTPSASIPPAEEFTPTPASISTPTEENPEEKHEYYIKVKLDSKAISENLIGEKTEQSLVIYLPPTYYEGNDKYPVIYYLHGFGDSVGAYLNSSKRNLNEAFTNGEKEFIMVEVDGSNLVIGSFYVNSPVIGNWEDYTTKEVVSYIDSNYRTIASPESRGICGFSMGGFGALNLALLHPDIYGAVYSMSPGIIAEGRLTDALDTWKYDVPFKEAYSMAFAYETAPPYGKIPVFDGSKEDNDVIKKWESGFEDWPEKLDAYLALNTPLRAIGLSYGHGDYYPWIPVGTAYFSKLLTDKEIKHTLFTFDGGHMQPPYSIIDHLVPFFREALVW